MVNASKILTVSYGTFSCTLEGFDDPVGAMQTVAEYFRDLAADDPHFGAEPPKLDQAALNEIAERRTQKRVDAKVERDNLVIRQIDAPADETSPVEPSREVVSQAGEAPAPSSAAQAEAPVADSPVSKLSEAGVAESVAEKLARIRAAVSRSRSEPEPLLNQMFVEDEGAAPSPEPKPEVPFEPIDALDDAEPLSFDEQDDVDVAGADTSDEMDLTGLIEGAEAVPEETTAPAGRSGAGSGELDAMDGGRSEPVTEDPIAEASERETPEADAVVPEEAISASAPSVAEEEAEAIPEDVAEAEQDAVEEQDSLAAVLAQTAALAPDADDAPYEDEPEDSAAAEVTAGDLELSAILQDAAPQEDLSGAEVEKVAQGAPEPLDLSSILGPEPEDQAPASQEQLVPEAVEETAEEAFEPSELDATESDLTGEDAAAEAAPSQEEAPRVRVMKMSREAFERQFEEVPEDETEDETKVEPEDVAVQSAAPAPQPSDIREALGETGLSTEDEEDLIRELMAASQDGEAGAPAEPEAVAEMPEELNVETVAEQPAPEQEPLVLTPSMQSEATLEEAEDVPSEVAEDPGVVEGDVHRALENLVAEADKVTSGAPRTLPSENDDASMDRLLAEADSAMEDNEGNRRRSAIAHLKAAVAAVRADGDRERDAAEAETARTMDQFREDLARAVRPNASGTAPSADSATDTPDALNDDTAEPELQQPAAESAHVTPKRPVAGAVSNAEVGESAASARPRRAVAPLMLVSEQRVDQPEPDAQAEPVRPRRVRSDAPEPGEIDGAPAASAEDSSDGFKAFLIKTKADGLQEELEASLAYGIFVEGAPHNARPKIMGRVLRQYTDGSVTREDGLRAFGVLLREGRINRIRRGEFTLPDSSRFHPENNAQADSA